MNDADVVWFKSSFSAANGQCVEVAWKKSSFSGASGDCVEVVEDLDDGLIYVRDSKNVDGPQLIFNRGEWQAFLDGAKAGEFDLQ
jgi:hypothetical protein